MAIQTKNWNIKATGKIKDTDGVINTLLKNRNVTSPGEIKEFVNPRHPTDYSLKEVGIKESEVKKACKRIEVAIKNKENVIVYGDYDADGITGTATMWETLHELGVNVLPHIPDRFNEGYGLNIDTVKKLKEKDPNLKLIITVDHGIVAGGKIEEAKKIGVDIIISDHHQPGHALPKPLALIYTTTVGGSAVAWFLARELARRLKAGKNFNIENRLELAAIGTIADQLQLTGINRSIVKYGLVEINKTKRPGLNALFEEAKVKRGEIGTYEIGFLVAPRINSMGRLKHGLESLRLLCTRDNLKAMNIAVNIGETNIERQKIVETVIAHARNSYTLFSDKSVIVLSDKTYHEGVIGLAAAKLVEEFYKPAIVLSVNGDVAKASARSISGFNIIEAIRKLERLYLEGGGHPMAAGFSIKTENIEKFSVEINKIAKEIITPEILTKKLTVDLELDFPLLDKSLSDRIKAFEPFGLGNFEPVFVTYGVTVLETKTVGRESKHLKVKVEQEGRVFEAIAFGFGLLKDELKDKNKINIVYNFDENVWNGNVTLQLKIKDIAFAG